MFTLSENSATITFIRITSTITATVIAIAAVPYLSFLVFIFIAIAPFSVMNCHAQRRFSRARTVRKLNMKIMLTKKIMFGTLKSPVENSAYLL